MDHASNVVRLPNAARRQVCNNRWKEQRAASRAAKAETASRFDFQSPGVRAAMKDAAIISEIEQSPAMLIASTLFALADAETQQKGLEKLAPGAAAGRRPHIQAVTVMRRMRPQTVGAEWNLMRAMEELAKAK